jgi:hypothetical protein
LELKQVAHIFVGHPFRDKISEVTSSSVRVIQMKDVSLDMGIDWNACLKTKLTGKCNPEWLKPCDILFAARGSRNYAVSVDQTAHQIHAVAAPHFYILRCTSKHILPDYLAWLLNQDPCQRYFQREAEGTLTKSIRRGVLEATPIVIPSIAKQQSIIHLAKVLRQEHQWIKQLTQSSQMLMKALTIDLLKELN